MFSYIVVATSVKHALTILQTKFQRTSEVIEVKLQTLKQEVETMSMKGNEAVWVYISKAMEIVNHILTYGVEISD